MAAAQPGFSPVAGEAQGGETQASGKEQQRPGCSFRGNRRFHRQGFRAFSLTAILRERSEFDSQARVSSKQVVYTQRSS